MVSATIRMVVLDIDGTLVDDRKDLPPQNAAAVARIKSRGIKVTLATGRTWGSAMLYARPLGIDLPLITHSGAYVAGPDRKEWSRTPLDMNIAREMIRLLEQEEYYLKVYMDDCLYVQEETPETRSFSQRFQVPFRVAGRGNLSALTENPLRMVLIDTPERIQRAHHLVKPWEEHFSFVRDSERGLEIVDRTVSKGAALERLCAALEISPEQVMAFGNEGNDLELLRVAGVGVAMGNSFSGLKQIARIVAPTNEENGVAWVLNRVFPE